MKLKLISDGTPIGTKLIDEDSGQSFPGIQEIRWINQSDEDLIPKLTLTTVCASAEMTLPAKIYKVRLSESGEAQNTGFENKTVKIVSEQYYGDSLFPMKHQVYDLQGNMLSNIQRIDVKITANDIVDVEIEQLQVEAKQSLAREMRELNKKYAETQTFECKVQNSFDNLLRTIRSDASAGCTSYRESWNTNDPIYLEIENKLRQEGFTIEFPEEYYIKISWGKW